MANKMLIDASHPEETRVVVLRGNRVEEFDFEAASKKQLRGNIYLAKVTRVEPSLQAAFVDYGGNRHGFLAFSEIHPDYYQIPVVDRQALIDEEAKAQRDEDDDASGHGAPVAAPGGAIAMVTRPRNGAARTQRWPRPTPAKRPGMSKNTCPAGGGNRRGGTGTVRGRTRRRGSSSAPVRRIECRAFPRRHGTRRIPSRNPGRRIAPVNRPSILPSEFTMGSRGTTPARRQSQNVRPSKQPGADCGELEQWQHLKRDGFQIANLPRHGGPAFTVIAERTVLAAMAERMKRSFPEIRELNARTLETIRVENGIALIGTDTNERTLALEARLEPAIAFNKGCYVGQETVERATARGALKRRLYGLRFAAKEMPSLGASIQLGDITGGNRDCRSC